MYFPNLEKLPNKKGKDLFQQNDENITFSSTKLRKEETKTLKSTFSTDLNEHLELKTNKQLLVNEGGKTGFTQDNASQLTSTPKPTQISSETKTPIKPPRRKTGSTAIARKPPVLTGRRTSADIVGLRKMSISNSINSSVNEENLKQKDTKQTNKDNTILLSNLSLSVVSDLDNDSLQAQHGVSCNQNLKLIPKQKSIGRTSSSELLGIKDNNQQINFAGHENLRQLSEIEKDANSKSHTAEV